MGVHAVVSSIALIVIAAICAGCAVNAIERRGPWSFTLRCTAYLISGMAILVLLGSAGAIAELGVLIASSIVCLAIVECDFRWYLIPDTLVIALLALGFVGGGADNWAYALTGSLLGGGLFLAVRVGFYRFRGFHGLGLGDVKLAAGIGSLVGPGQLPLVIVGGAMLTAVLHLALFRLAPSRLAEVSGRQAAPLGVGLAIACVASAWMFGLAQ